MCTETIEYDCIHIEANRIINCFSNPCQHRNRYQQGKCQSVCKYPTPSPTTSGESI